jgi:hypothetical protein
MKVPITSATKIPATSPRQVAGDLWRLQMNLRLLQGNWHQPGVRGYDARRAIEDETTPALQPLPLPLD